MACASDQEVADARQARSAARAQTRAANAAAEQAATATTAADGAARRAREATTATDEAAARARTATLDVTRAADAAEAAAVAANAAAEQARARAEAANNGDIEAQRVEREKFDYLAARVKGVVHVPFVLAMMLYPTVLGFCLAIRLGRFNLTMPTPNLNSTPAPAAALGSEQDLWRTDGALNIALLVFTFVVVSGVHIAITAFLLLKASAGGASLRPAWCWAAAILFWAATTLYLIYFVSVARYGPGMGEWIGAGITSGFILLTSVYMLVMPSVTDRVVIGLAGLGAPAPASA